MHSVNSDRNDDKMTPTGNSSGWAGSRVSLPRDTDAWKGGGGKENSRDSKKIVEQASGGVDIDS